MEQQADNLQQVLAEQMETSRQQAAAIKPGPTPYDVIIVGSGAAGGMAAYQLATAGVKVLLLEAGRMIDTIEEYRTMEWPYASLRRGRIPGDEHAFSAAEYNMIDRPYGTAGPPRVPEAAVVLRQYVYAELAGRREAEPDHRHQVRMGARPRAGREDESLGTRGATHVRLRLQGSQPRRLRRRLADLRTPTCRRTTTAWTRSSASRGRKRTFRSFPTASSSAP